MESIEQLRDVCSIESNNPNAAIRANNGNIFVFKMLIFGSACNISMVHLCHLFMNIYLNHLIDYYYTYV